MGNNCPEMNLMDQQVAEAAPVLRERHIVAVAEWAELQYRLKDARRRLSEAQSKVACLERDEATAASAAANLLPPSVERYFNTDHGFVKWDGRGNVKLQLLDCANAREQ